MSTGPDNTIRRIAIVGGGLAGMTAALRLSDLAGAARLPVVVTLFEASNRLGGVIDTVRERDYLIERGADSFLRKPPLIRLCQRLGLTDALLPTNEQHRRALVLSKGRPLPVPHGFGLMAPARLRPVLTSPILSPIGKLRLMAEKYIPPRQKSGDESLGSFARRRLGDEVFERLVQPLVAGIYTADPEKLSLAATLPRFLEMERTHGSLIRAMKAGAAESGEASGARYQLFAGFRDGMQQFLTALGDEVLQETTVRLGTPIAGLRRDRSQWHIETEEGGPPEPGFDAVILALPAYAAADLLSQAAGGLVSLLRLIPYASSAVIATGYQRKDIRHPLDAFGLVIPAIEKRDVLAVSFASRKFPQRAPHDRVLLRTFVGGATRPDLLRMSDDELTVLVRRELGTLLGASGMPEVTVVTRFDNAMPQYHVGHLDVVAEIDQALDRIPGLALAGSAYRGVGLADVIADAERAAERVFGATTTR